MDRLRWIAGPIVVGLLIGNLHPSTAQGQGGLATFREVHLGMTVRITLPAGPGAANLAAAAFDRVEQLDLVLSDWRAASELRRVTELPRMTWAQISPELNSVLALALEVARATNGAFDPTVGPLTLLWRETRATGKTPSDSARGEAATRIGWWFVDLDSRHLRVRFARDGMRLDLGAIAKGWILDQAARVLQDGGRTSFLIEAGGDILVGQAPPGRSAWRIDVLTDRGDSVVTLVDQALSTSGPGAQSIIGADGRAHSHVIDLTQRSGLTAARQVTVTGRRAALTDALATAFTLVDRQQWPALARRFGVQLVTATSD